MDAACSLTYSLHRFLCSYINMVRNITRIITNTCQVGRHTCGRTLIIWRLVELQGSWYRPAVVCKKNLLLEGKVLLKKYWKILRHLLCSCASHHTRYTTEEMLLGALLIISWEHDMIHIVCSF